MTRTIRTASLLVLSALSSTAPAFYDVYPDRVSLLRGVRGDAFSHTYRSFTGQYSSSPYSRTLNGWNVDVSTPIGGTTALFLTNNGIGAASSLTSTFISTGPRTATAAAMKVFVLNNQLTPIAGTVTVTTESNADYYTLNVPIEGTYLAFTTQFPFSQLTVNADSGFECVDDVVIGDAVNMPNADHCVAAPLMYYTPGFTIPHPFTTIHTGADLINWFAPGNPNFPANRDIWYRWVAPETGTVVFSTVDPTTNFDTVLAVYDNTFGSCPFSNQNPVAFNDDAVGLRSSITMRAGSGSLFYVRLGGYNGATGSGTLNLTFVADCPADVNHDQVVDFFDYLDFVSAFSVPCP